MTIHQLAQSMFGEDITDPGLLRVLNHAGESLHGNTQVGHLQVPRMLYFQTGSLAKFELIKETIGNAQHDAVLTRAAEARLHLV